MKKKVNLLSVSVRILLMALLCTAALLLRGFVGGIISIVLLLPAAAVLVQLVIWAAKWVRTESVSELGLHIVRFWVIVTAVALSIFIMLSVDYSAQHDKSAATELEQIALSGSYYLRGELSDSVLPDRAALTDLSAALDSLLLDTDNNLERDAIIYLYAEAEPADVENTGFSIISDTVIAAATNQTLLENSTADAQAISASDLSAGETAHAGGTYISAYCPLYTENGRLVGYLEICESRNLAGRVLRYASIELFLSVAALIALFCFLFYGIMQLVDIVLRPRRFDPTRVLPFGRESVRPFMFTVTLAFAYPILPLVFTDSELSFAPTDTIWGYILAKFLPAAVYIAGGCIGLFFGTLPKSKLKAAPAAAGLLVSVAGTIAARFIDNGYVFLAGIFAAGIGLGTAYRVGSRYREHADSVYKVDDYAYLCPTLGAISGLILGVLFSGAGIFSPILSCALIALAELVCILMLRDVDFTEEELAFRKLKRSRGSLIAILLPGAACAYLWIYVAGMLYHTFDLSLLAVSACVAAPLIAFCFGNRLRMTTRASQRLVIFIGGLLAAAAFIPLAVSSTVVSALISAALVCLSVIFASSAIYSILFPSELKKAAGMLRILLLPGVALFGYLSACNLLPGGLISADILHYICAFVALVLSLVFIVMSKFPERLDDDAQQPALDAPEPPTASLPASSEPAQEALPAPATAPEPAIIPEPEVVSDPEPAVIPEPESKPEPEPVIVPEPETAPEAEPVIIPEPEAAPEAEPIIIPESDAAPETSLDFTIEDEIIEIDIDDQTNQE